LDQGEYAAALSVLEQSLVANPKNFKSKNNIAYIVQEWAKDAASDGDILAAEKIVATNRARFPSASQLGNLQSSFVIRAVNAAKSKEDFEALVDTLQNAEPLAKSTSRYGDVTVYFYAEWAKLSDPKFKGDEALSVLQAGVDRHPETRKLVRLFTQAVNYNGELAMADQDWAGALAIFKAAQRSLPNERSFQRNIEKCEAQL
jgi:tetratricopeptide (TPR) repeat protein